MGRLPLHGRCHYRAQLLELNRLAQVIECACAQGFDSIFRRTVGGDHHAPLTAAALLQLLQDFHAQPIGQAHVSEYNIEAGIAQFVARLLQAFGRFDRVALAQQSQLVEQAQVGFIVNDQNRGFVLL